MSETKIRLSREELQLAGNAEVILTKNAIIEKTKHVFGLLQDKQEQYLTSQWSLAEPSIINSSSKISRGENYRGLPYLVLDYPRIFEKDNIAAIRTMFWWGNLFSVTLHLSGNYKMEFERPVLNSYKLFRKKGFYCCASSNEWQHHFEPDNYVPIKELSYDDFEKMIQEKPFLKIACHFPVEIWNDAPEVLYQVFIEIIDVLKDQAPRR